MNTKTLSNHALSVIDQYLHFKVGSAECSIPYFNNKTVRARAAFRSAIGKGSPKEIYEEAKSVLVKDHVDESLITDSLLKKTLVDNGIGIDCSAFAYYVLNAECRESRKGSLDKHIRFVNCRGIVGKMRCALRPIENCDVATLADDENSRAVPIQDVRPGDMIAMIGGPDNLDRDHILVIHQVEYQNSAPIKMHYSHASADPEDGVYGTGVKQGLIEVTKPDSPITEQAWTENGRAGADNPAFRRAQRSKTGLRRLKAFS